MIIPLVGILAGATLVFIIGLFLPKEMVFEKEAVLHQPIEKVFQVVTDYEDQTIWRTDVKAIKIIDGKTWTEIPQKGRPITFRTKRKIENKLFEIEIIDPKSFNGYWIGTFDPRPDQSTLVNFKEVIRIDNPFFRTLSFIFVDLDKTMETYLTNLKTHLGE
ncbi:SRPBCC family protein [Pararhodonellum marinum]|uniref:SRPBCC family protein n=1 Tax=Pararhodonellum marinum TaxID=2755358 RepID=UPI00188F533A|nr:SRPBCC family protein [Pararhodonellum marinum]